MKHAIIYLFLLPLFLSAQNVESKAFDLVIQSLVSEAVPTMDVETLEKVDFNGFVFLDTRERWEYQVSHLNGAIWVGYDDFDPERIKDLPKDCKIITYCSIGVRSEDIGERLIDLGYEDVHNLYGGIFEWANRENVVIDSVGKTSKVAAYSKLWGIWLQIPKTDKVYQDN